MAKVDVGDLNKDGDDPKKEVTLTEDEIEHVKGGAGYLKIGDIKGESTINQNQFKVEIEGIAPTLDKTGWKI